MKKGYMIYPHWWETIKKLPREDKGELMEVIFTYINEWEVIDMSFHIELVFTSMLEQFKIDEEKYEKICKRNKENIEKRYTKSTTGKTGIPKSTKSTDKDKDKDNGKDNEKDKEITITSNTEVKTSEIYWNVEINDMLWFLCKSVWIDTFKETVKLQRQYWKHIVNYWKKQGKEDFIERLKWILSDDFKAKNCNSIKYLYNEIKAYIHSPVIEEKKKTVGIII